MSKSYSRSKGRSEDRQYFGLPRIVTGHPNFIKLSAQANKLLVDVGRQFTGRNNGDLCATWSLMQKRGWKSRETLNDALRELEYYEFLIVTQYGDRKRPTLFALTWKEVHKAVGECRGLLKTTPGGWKHEKKRFVKPSTKRISKKSVTRYAGQTSTECGSKKGYLEVVK